MGMEASFTDVVGSVVHGRWSGVYRRRGRKFYCARRCERKSVVAFSVRSIGIFLADDLCGGWEAICGGGGWVGVVYVWIAVSTRKSGSVAVPERRITGFHQDEKNDWVAELECGHTQHVRHDPPWMNRPWVMSEEGRATRIGTTLLCKKCDQQS